MDLGTPPGLEYSWANGINDQGQAVGASYGNWVWGWDSMAFLWSPGGGAVCVGEGYSSEASGINYQGQVVGSFEACFYDGGPAGYAFLGTVNLGLGGANGINDQGQVVGCGGDYGHAFLWSPGGGTVDMGTLPGDTQSQANGINDQGQVVGQSGSHAFLWSPGGAMQGLGTLPGYTQSCACGISDSGQVAGWSVDSSGEHAVVWVPSGGAGGSMLSLSPNAVTGRANRNRNGLRAGRDLRAAFLFRSGRDHSLKNHDKWRQWHLVYDFQDILPGRNHRKKRARNRDRAHGIRPGPHRLGDSLHRQRSHAAHRRDRPHRMERRQQSVWAGFRQQHYNGRKPADG